MVRLVGRLPMSYPMYTHRTYPMLALVIHGEPSNALMGLDLDADATRTHNV